MYNKDQFTKAQDKKILHKVKKQWIVVSMSLLALLGGSVVAEYVSAHADTTNNNQGQSILKDRINQNLAQTNSVSLVQRPAQAQSAQNNVNLGRISNHNQSFKSNFSSTHVDSQAIINQAKVLHDRILNHASQVSDQQRFLNGSNPSNAAQKPDQHNGQSSKAVNPPVVSEPLVGEAENGEDGDPSFPYLPRSDQYDHKVVNLHSHGVYYKYVIQGSKGDVVHLPGNNQYVKFGNSNDSTGQVQLLDSDNNPYDIPSSINGLTNNFYTFSDEAFNPEYVSYRITPNLKFYSGRNGQVIDKNIQGRQKSVTVNGYVGEPYIIYPNGDLIGQFNGYRRPISTDHNIPNDNPLYAVINSDQDNGNPNTWLNGRDTFSLVSQPDASPITFKYSTSDGVQVSDTERPGGVNDPIYVDDILTARQIRDHFNTLKFTSGPYAGQNISTYFQLPDNLNNYNYKTFWQNLSMHLQGKNAPAAQTPVTFDEYDANGNYERSYSGKTNVGHKYGTTSLTYKISPSDTIVSGINPFDTGNYSISTGQNSAVMDRTVQGNQYQWIWDKSKSQGFQIDNKGLHIKMYDTHHDSDGGLYINVTPMYFGIRSYQIKNLHDIKGYSDTVPRNGFNVNYNVPNPNNVDKKAWPNVQNAQLVNELYDSNKVPPVLPVGTIGSISPESENWASVQAAGPGIHQLFYEYTSNGPKWLKTFAVPLDPNKTMPHASDVNILGLPEITFVNGSRPAYPYIDNVYYTPKNKYTGTNPYQFNGYNLQGQSFQDNWTKQDYFYPNGLPTLQTYNSDGQAGPLLKYDLSHHQWFYPTTRNGVTPTSGDYQQVNPVPSDGQQYANGDSSEYFNAYSPAQPMTVSLKLAGTNQLIESKTIKSNIDDIIEYRPRTNDIITAPSPYTGHAYNMSPTQEVMSIPKYYVYDNKQSPKFTNGSDYGYGTLGNSDSGLNQSTKCTIYVKEDPRYTHLNWDGQYHTIIGQNSPGILRAIQVDKQGHMTHYMQFNSNKDYRSPQGSDTTTYMPNESMLTGPDVANEKQALMQNYSDLRPDDFDDTYGYNHLTSHIPVLSENGKVATWTYTEPTYGEIGIHYIASDGRENHPETQLYAYETKDEDIADAVNDDEEQIFNYSHQAPVYVLVDTTNPSSKHYDEDELFNNSSEVDFDNSKYHDIYIYFTTANITTHLKAGLKFENYDGTSASPHFSNDSERAVYNAENIQASGLDKKNASGHYRFYADLPMMPNQLTSDGGTVYDLTKSQNLIGNYDSYDDKTDGTNNWVNPASLPAYTYQAHQGQAVVKLHDVSNQRPDETDDIDIPLNAGSHQDKGYQELPSNLIPDGYQIATQPVTHDNVDQHLSEYKVRNGNNDGQNETVLDIAPVEPWPIKVQVEDANGNLVSPDNYDATSVLNAANSRPINYINDSYSDYDYSGQNNYYHLGQVTLPLTITDFNGNAYYLKGNTIADQISPYDYNSHKWQTDNNNVWEDADEPTYTYKAYVPGAATFHYVDETEGHDIAGADHVMYKPGNVADSYDPSGELQALENQGYVLDASHHNASDYNGTPFSFSYNGTNQNFYIYLKHGIATDQIDHSHHENIQFKAGPGVSADDLPGDVHLTTVFGTGVKVDEVTGQIISRDNSLISGPGEWESVTIPKISDCNWSELGTYDNSGQAASSVPATFPNHDIDDVITYNRRAVDIDFDLSGRNIPAHYKGLTGIISSDTNDYQGNTNDNSYYFRDGSDGYNGSTGVKGLSSDYHIVGNQTVPYDGLTHRVHVAPNEERGYINYVYTDKRGNQHLVKQVPLNKSQSDAYGVQFHVNDKRGVSDERDEKSQTNSTGLSSSDQFQGTGNYSNNTYRLVNQGSDDNGFIFDDGKLLNGKPQGDPSEQDNPEKANYNPSNNVFTVPVEPVNGSKVDSNIDIYYVNETGQQIGGVKTFNGDYGASLNSINTTGPNKGKEASDKIVSNNPDPADYKVDLTGEQLRKIYSTYHFASDVQDITIPLKGDNTNNQSNAQNQVTVNVKRVNSDGTAIQPAQSVTIHLNGQIGNFVTLKPSDLLSGGKFAGNVPSGALNNYVVDSKYPDTSYGDTNAKNDWDTKPVIYYLKGNGNGSATLYTKVSDANMIDNTTGSQTKGDQVGPHYVPNSIVTQPTFTYINHKPGTITLTYKDAQTGQVVDGKLNGKTVSSDVITPTASDYGESINLINPKSTLNAPADKTAQGESVPSDYALADANMPNTIYTINGNQQDVTLYVKRTNGQEKTTNTGSSYPLIINRVEHIFVNGRDTGRTQLASTATPKISNIVGGSDTLNASTYAPNDGNNIVDAASDASYQIKFNNDNPGSLTVTDYNNGKGNNVSPTSVKPNDTLTSTDGADGTKEIVFNYNDYQTVAQKHNYVHYISYSDMDNNSDITKTFNDKNFLTTLSDTGSDTHSFNNEPYYTTNVPQGFQFYKIWKVQDQNGSRTNDYNPGDPQYNSHKVSGLTNFGSKDQNEYIEVIPNASQITVHYVDQNGHQLSQNTYSGSDQGQISQLGYSSRYGQFIPETGNNSIESNVPQGYQLEVQPYHTADNSVDHNSTFMFGRQPQDVKVTVVGNSEANNPITVKYINQAGSLVGYQSFVGRLGDQVNVVGNSVNYDFNGNNISSYQNVPKGYTLVGNNQPTTYSFENRPYTVYMNVKGQNVSHKLTIERVMKQSDGITKVSDGSPINISGSDGSVYEVNPGTYTPNGYTPDYSKDSVQFITLNQNQKLMPNKVVFYYDDQTTNGVPIMIHYVNQVGDQVGSQILNGNVGDQTKDANDLFNSQPDLKNSYQLDTGKTHANETFTFSNSPQTNTIYLKGNSNSTPFDLKIITENADGSKAKVSDKKINVGSQVGDHFDISPYDASYMPSGGFHPTESDSDISGTVEANGKLSPVNTAAFVYQNDSGQGTEGIGTVRVHYVTKSPASDGGINASTGQPNDGDEIDEESDQGYVDTDTFDTTPYLHDIPESVAQFYDLPAGEKALDKHGRAIDNDTWKFASDVKDIYVKVERTNGPIIID